MDRLYIDRLKAFAVDVS